MRSSNRLLLLFRPMHNARPNYVLCIYFIYNIYVYTCTFIYKCIYTIKYYYACSIVSVSVYSSTYKYIFEMKSEAILLNILLLYTCTVYNCVYSHISRYKTLCTTCWFWWCICIQFIYIIWYLLYPTAGIGYVVADGKYYICVYYIQTLSIGPVSEFTCIYIYICVIIFMQSALVFSVSVCSPFKYWWLQHSNKPTSKI